MKKLRNLLLVLLVVVVTTGCVKFNANMKIKADKSMEFSVVYAFDKSLMGEDNALKEEDMAEPKKCGFEVSKYSEGNYEGFKLTKKIANIDEVSSETDVTYNLSGMMDEGVCDGKMFKIVKGEDKNTYIATMKFDADSGNMEEPDDEKKTNEEVTDDEELGDLVEVPELKEYNLGDEDDDEELSVTSNGNDMDLSALMNNLDLSFSVNLPYSAISSNATTKENNNKDLTWKLGATGEQKIEFTFEIPNNAGNNNMILYIGIGAAVLVLAVICAVVLSKKKKPVENVPEPVEPKQ